MGDTCGSVSVISAERDGRDVIGVDIDKLCFELWSATQKCNSGSHGAWTARESQCQRYRPISAERDGRDVIGVDIDKLCFELWSATQKCNSGSHGAWTARESQCQRYRPMNDCRRIACPCIFPRNPY